MTDDAAPIPAATVIVMRNRGAMPPEILFVERAATMAFAPGAVVFPGGRVDAADRALAARLALPDADEGAHRIAAIRETIEETGIVTGLIGPPPDVAELRGRLHDGCALGDLVAADTLALDALVPFARWMPQGVAHRVFDTRFYIARGVSGGGEPVADAGENSRAFWAGAQDVLDAADAGTARLIFPTRRTLERLARYRSYDDALADAARFPVRTIVPRIEQRDGQAWLCIPDDLAYPVTAEPLSDVERA